MSIAEIGRQVAATTARPIVFSGGGVSVSVPVSDSTMQAIIKGADGLYGPGLLPMPDGDRVRIALRAEDLILVSLTMEEARTLQAQFSAVLADRD
jgi:hypothetical protein